MRGSPGSTSRRPRITCNERVAIAPPGATTTSSGDRHSCLVYCIPKRASRWKGNGEGGDDGSCADRRKTFVSAPFSMRVRVLPRLADDHHKAVASDQVYGGRRHARPGPRRRPRVALSPAVRLSSSSTQDEGRSSGQYLMGCIVCWREGREPLNRRGNLRDEQVVVGNQADGSARRKRIGTVTWRPSLILFLLSPSGEGNGPSSSHSEHEVSPFEEFSSSTGKKAYEGSDR